MVAYLEKSDMNAEFHQIVDFLSTCLINYAFTVSPTIYASYIEQFWNTDTSKTVNSVKQIHVIVNGKAVVISESSVRNDLLFDDEDGITCLTNDDIFENLALIGWQSQAPRNHGGAPAQTRSERVLKQPNEPPLPEGHTSGSGEGRMEHTFELMDIVPPTPHDSPLPGGYTPGSDEGRLKLEELMAMCIKLSKQVLDLEKEKDAQAVEILKLKKRMRRMHPNKGKSDKTKPMFKDSDFDGLDDDMANVEGETVYAATFGVSILEDEIMTMADTLIAIRQTRTRPSYLPRPTSVVIIDTEHEQRRLTTPPPSQPSDTRDKGKETIAAQRKFRAAQRVIEIRSKPPTKTQLRNMMITYLKNMGKFNHNQLKGKSYEELQRLFEREQKWINDFVPMDSEKEEKKSVEPESEGKKGKRIKRVTNSALKHKSSKKQKMMQEQESAKRDEDAVADYEHEQEELRMWLTVVPDEEETVDLEILSAKYHIVDWESQNLRNVDMEDLHVYKIIRADGNTSYHKSLFSMLRKFNRQDLVDLHRLVMKSVGNYI
ncbi:hypothetical protein Tco_1123571 [Tanacetum coccineum]|uniref:Xylulose kinase-1 n=1 Tax=Tanacetum coccineum TaxID=301880 RepID=A0ABQ5J494_9ASTR